MSHEYTGAPTFSGAMHKLNKEVTRAGQKLSSDDTFRGFMDKAQGAMAFEPLKKAVVKATSLEHGPPKEKHVQFLMHEMRDANIRDIFEEVFLRLHNKDATIVLKSIMVFHRLLGGAPPSYKLFDRIYASRGEFRLSRFLDETTHESMQASRMVQSYAMFMEEKIEMHHDVRFPYERNTEDAARHVADISPEQLMQDVKSIMSLLDVGYKCSFREVSTVHPTSIAAFSLIFKDMRILYHALNKGVLRLLENYFEMPKMVASKILALYKNFLDHAKKEKIDLNPPPESFLEALVAYLDQEDYQPSQTVRQTQDDVQNVPVIQLADLIGDMAAQEEPVLKPTQDFMDSLFGDLPDSTPATVTAAPAPAPAPAPARPQAQSVDDLFGDGPAAAASGAGGGGFMSFDAPQQAGGNPFAANPFGGGGGAAGMASGMGMQQGMGGMGRGVGMGAQSM
ncbi:ANTH domain-containing protein, partial [Baffinella frigidus]